MKNDFRKFANNYNSNKGSNNMGDNGKSHTNEDMAQKARNMTKPYENMNDDQLLKEIKKMAGNGVDSNELNKFINQVSPMLDSEGRKRLQTIINMLNK